MFPVRQKQQRLAFGKRPLFAVFPDIKLPFDHPQQIEKPQVFAVGMLLSRAVMRDSGSQIIRQRRRLKRDKRFGDHGNAPIVLNIIKTGLFRSYLLIILKNIITSVQSSFLIFFSGGCA